MKYGGVIRIRRADNVLIRGCHLTNNHVVGYPSRGDAIYARNTVAMYIEGNLFDNNYAGYSGGAIYVNHGNINSTGDQYINNSADSAGGAIFVFFGNIYSTGDQYINNSADSIGRWSNICLP